MTSTTRKRKNSLSAKTVPVRRFEPGASSLYFFAFLEGCGYSVHSINGHRYGVRFGKIERYKNMTHAQVMELVDELRKNSGLEPFRKNCNK